MVCGTVIVCKCDHDGNPVGHPILYMNLYDFELLDKKITTLAANTKAKVMYAQCNFDGNEYLLHEDPVDVQKDSMTKTLDK